MAQIFRRRSNAIVKVALVAVVFVPVAALVFAGVMARSRYTNDIGLTPDQPVPFSHQHHVGGLGLDCRYCHTGVEEAAFAGVPPTHTCMTCHSQLWTNAEMLRPIRESLAKDEPIAWNRVTNLPDYVYFNHSVHVENGVGCTTCHGSVDKMPLMQKAEPMTMQWCLDCHRDPAKNLRAPEDVFATNWNSADGKIHGHERLKRYGIDPAKLTDCSTCHR
ncbi:cytochrome c3 family protein [Afifella sp. YEN Y35]|uniref:cytochrome c3 family protein n=1 Tax=Afifella sp. YEN Y35 TaxID=3388337 RepID=UPI0039E151CA